MKTVITKVIIWLIIVNVFAFAMLNRFNLSPDTAYQWITPESFPTAQSWDFVGMHFRWDSYWYLDIIQHGYYLQENNTLSNVVFFPLYPFLIKIVGIALLGKFALAGWLISMAALIGACAFFYELLREFHPDIEAEKPILLMLIFPTAFFFNVMYTESLFLLMTMGTFYFALRKEYYKAGAFALLGALTHSNGVFLSLPIVWKIIEQHGWKSIMGKKIIPAFFAPIGTFSFLLYDYLKFKDLFLFFKIESAWGRGFVFNIDHFSFFSHPSIVNMGIDAAFTVLIIGAIVLVWKKLNPLYSVFMSLTVLSALTSGTLMSIGRYSLVLFPLFILLANLKGTKLQTWIFSSALLLAMDIILWVNNYWAG